MAERFELRSVGGAASRALRDALLQQEVERRTQMLDGLTIQSRLQEQARAENEARRQAAADRLAAADRAATLNGPDQDLEAGTAATLRAGGYRINEQRTLPGRSIGVIVGDGVSTKSDLLQPRTYARRGETVVERLARETTERAAAEKKEALLFRGEQADAERAFRGEQANATRNAAKERADADREMKQLIAHMGSSNNYETRALGNEMKRLQIAAEEEKLSTQKTERERSESARKQRRAAIATLAQSIKADPNFSYAVGPMSTRNPFRGAGSAELYRKINQLKAMLSLDERGKLKGQGAITDFETRMLADAVARLDPSMEEANLGKELDRIADIMKDEQ
jgi:hypothetical protein